MRLVVAGRAVFNALCTVLNYRYWATTLRAVSARAVERAVGPSRSLCQHSGKSVLRKNADISLHFGLQKFWEERFFEAVKVKIGRLVRIDCEVTPVDLFFPLPLFDDAASSRPACTRCTFPIRAFGALGGCTHKGMAILCSQYRA